MKKLNAVILLVFFITTTNAQVDLNSIPDSLKENAEAILLSNNEVLEIFKNDLLVNTEVSELLILTHDNTDANKMIVAYDKFTKIEEINLTVFSLEGKKLKSVKKKEFVDQAHEDGISIAVDTRFLYYKISGLKPPYIIKREVKTVSTQSLNLGGYTPSPWDKVAVLNSVYTIINNDVNNTLRMNISIWGAPKSDTTETRHTHTWQTGFLTVNRLKAIALSNIDKRILPVLENFQMDGVQGSLKTWNAFGKWLNTLNQNMDILSEASTEEIKKVIGTEKDKHEIVKKLYAYLQQNMRYVSIQLGIGGYKPMPAQSVHDFKYGDCKALSNYMKALLKVADIPSRYVIINAGNNTLSPDIADVRNVFNHAILAVPMDGDTIFLECTSSSNHMGYQGSFTGNRKALMIDEENSKLINTKSYLHQQNIIENEVQISNLNTPEALISLNQTLSGIGTEYYQLNYLSDYTEDKFRNYLLDNVFEGATNFTVRKRNYPSTYEYDFASSKKILKTGSRFFIDVNMVKLPKSIVSDMSANTASFKIKTGYTISDTYRIAIPEGCLVEKNIKDFSFQSEAMDIKIETLATLGQIEMIRKMVFKAGDYTKMEAVNREAVLTQFKKSNTDKIVVNCRL